MRDDFLAIRRHIMANRGAVVRDHILAIKECIPAFRGYSVSVYQGIYSDPQGLHQLYASSQIMYSGDGKSFFWHERTYLGHDHQGLYSGFQATYQGLWWLSGMWQSETI